MRQLRQLTGGAAGELPVTGRDCAFDLRFQLPFRFREVRRLPVSVAVSGAVTHLLYFPLRGRGRPPRAGTSAVQLRIPRPPPGGRGLLFGEFV